MRGAKILFRTSLIGGALLFGLVSCGGGNDTPTASEGASQALNLNRAAAFNEEAGIARLQDKYADFSGDVVFDESGGIGKDSKRSNFEGRSRLKNRDWQLVVVKKHTLPITIRLTVLVNKEGIGSRIPPTCRPK